MTEGDCRVTRFESAGAFLERAESFLIRHEAQNCVLLGLVTQMLPAYMAMVSCDEHIAAAAVIRPPHNLILSTCEEPGAIAALAADAHNFMAHVPGVVAPVPFSKWFAEAWAAVSGDDITLSMPERLYQLTRVRPQRPVAGHARLANEGDRVVMRAWLTDYEIEALGEQPTDVDGHIDSILTVPRRGMYLWEVDGLPVSLAGFVGPTPHGIRIGPVYTQPALRGRGYASACVARLSQDMLDRGRTYCFLYTDLTNATSNHIYQEIGYEAVCDVAVYRFTQPAALG